MKRSRPQTASIIIDSKVSEVSSDNDTILKSFSSFMRQIVEKENGRFLTGDVNLIDYVLSKYLKIDIESLKTLNKLSIKINGSYGLLNQFGQRLTNLIYLKLNNSFIQSINDLGTNFTNLKIIQMNDCKLKDLGGLICFQHLEVFEAKNNQISDLIELEMCISLKKLDLENNLVDNIQNIYFLSSLDGLTYLNLLKNPIQNYEEKIKNLLPNLKELNIPNNDLCDDYYLGKNNKFTNVKISDSMSTNNDSKTINTNKTVINCDKKKENNNVNNTENNINEDIEMDPNNDDNINFMSINKSSSNHINNNSSINFSDTLNSTKTRFDFSMSLNKFKPIEATNLKPVITKKKEDKEIKLLRQSFSKGGMNSTMTNFKRFKSSDKNFGNFNMNKFPKNNIWPDMGKGFNKEFKNRCDKIKIKKDSFFEELKNKRLTGNK
jgi:Leucine-rich repeat (LRR) protein